MKHTPGPWETHKPDGYFGYLIYAPDESIVAREVNSEANARLIAAAPQLLEACKDMRAFMKAWTDEFGMSDREGLLMHQIDVAIEAAESES